MPTWDIVLKFSDRLDLSRLEPEQAVFQSLPGIERIPILRRGLISIARMLVTVTADELDLLRRKAGEHGIATTHWPDFENFFVLMLRAETETASQQLVHALKERYDDTVLEAAYLSRARRYSPTAILTGGTASTRLPPQDYLADVHAQAIWAALGGTPPGAGVALTVLEGGWGRSHVALTKVQILTETGWNDQGQKQHGTATLSIVVGDDATLPFQGLSPAPSRVDLHYLLRAQNDPGPNPCDALVKAATALGPTPGGVLLLEAAGSDDLPLELDLAVFEAIGALTDLGVTVVAPAGNDPKRSIDNIPGSVRRGDSGSIIVGGAKLDNGHWKLVTTGGKRVNCFARGVGVLAAGAWGRPSCRSGFNRCYTGRFGRSSAASAIIAGSATLVQSFALSQRGRALRPARLRALLSDPQLGQACQGESMMMPDLSLIMNAI